MSAYIPPGKPEVIFIWQIAVRRKERESGLAKSMLRRLLRQEACRDVRYIEATISPSNEASSGLFSSFAGELQADFEEKPFFPERLFPEGEAHEEEFLFQIGPIKQAKMRGV